MSGHLCADCQRCPACGRSAWCEGDRILVIPCEHKGYCGECNLTECAECRFAEMCESGEYSAEADPFINHLVPPAPDPVVENGGYFWEGAWVPVPKDAS